MKKKNFILFGVMLGPYIKNLGVPGAPKCQQMQTSSQWKHMHNEENKFENQFLAPPAEWQRSFSNTDSSVVVVIVVCRQLFT